MYTIALFLILIAFTKGEPPGWDKIHLEGRNIDAFLPVENDPTSYTVAPARLSREQRPEERPPVISGFTVEDDILNRLLKDDITSHPTDEENIQTEVVSGGWHGRSLLPASYDPLVDCLISGETNEKRYLYCPALAESNGPDTQFCCGTQEARYCCSAKDWQSLHPTDRPLQEESGLMKGYSEKTGRQITMDDVMKEFNKDFDEDDAETIGEHIVDDIQELSDSLPAWAQGLIIAGGILIGCILVYILLCCVWKLTCCSLRLLCCCCSKKDKHDEEQAVLVREIHHVNPHNPHSVHPHYGGTTTVYTRPQEGVPLYTNLTTNKLYPSLS